MSNNVPTCWIIGASHGIGKSLSIKYHEAGYDIAISARSLKNLQDLERDLSKKRSGKILINDFDINDFSAFKQAHDEVIKEFKKIDLIIFCSAIYEQMNIFDFDIDLAQKIIQTNIGGCLNLLKIIIPQMQQQNYGHIALVASVAGYCGLPNSLAYGASKAAMINLAEGIYPQLKNKNINLSLINPGFVDTRLTKKNKFPMPFIISQEEAAQEIFIGLKKKKFEVHFPKKFTLFLKILRILPYKIFFFVTKKIS